MKKIISLILSAALSVCLSAAAAADSAGFACEDELVLPAKTPYDKKYVEIIWHTDEASDAGVPISENEFLFFPVSNKIRKIGENDGKTIVSAELEEKVSENFKGAIVKEKLVQPTRTGICVVDTEDMSVLQYKKFGQISTDVAVIDDFVFFGCSSEESFCFYCVDINTLEVLSEFKSESKPSSPALMGDYVVFSCGEKLVCYSKSKNNFIENSIGAEINYVFAGEYAVFMSGSDGFMYKVRLNSDGTVEKNSLMKCEAGGELTAPAESGNRLYVGSSEGFFILDGLNMEIEKHYTEMKNACAPVITYGNGFRVYTAAPVESDGGKWYLYGIQDMETEQNINEIAKIIDFSNGKIAVSESGIMFFRDSRGQIWAIKVPENNIFLMILKIAIALAIIVFMILIIRAWVKKHSANKPKI